MNSKVFGLKFLAYRLLFFSLILLMFSASVFSAETAPLAVIEMNETSTMTILPNGDAQVKEDIALTATAFAAFKQQYPALSMFARVFEPKNMPLLLENLDVKVDEFNNKITASYLVKGMSVNKDSHWEIVVAAESIKPTLSAQTANALVFTYADQGSDYKKMITTTINLPDGVSNISFDAESNKVKYELPYSEGFSMGNILFLIIAVLAIAAAIYNQTKLNY
ncbi:MAG: hypothetical protein AABW72_04765 [archaeon]